MNYMTNKNFISDNDNRSFNIPFIVAPEIELDNKEKYPVLLHSSEELLENHYKNLQSSELRTKDSRLKTKDNSREISSTSINKLIQERKTR